MRLKEDEFWVILTMHHIVMDKWSMNLLQNEEAEYYRKLFINEEVKFLTLTIQYAHYAY